MTPTPLTALLPLEPPPAPPAPLPVELLLGPVVVLLIATLLWRRRPQRRWRRRLRSLSRQLRRDDCDTRALAAELDALLRSALGRARLQHQQPPAGLTPARWQGLLDGLHEARFAPRPPEAAALEGLIGVAQQLLHSPRERR